MGIVPPGYPNMKQKGWSFVSHHSHPLLAGYRPPAEREVTSQGFLSEAEPACIAAGEMGTPAGRRNLGQRTSGIYYIPLDYFETSYPTSFCTSSKCKCAEENFDSFQTCLIPKGYSRRERCVSTSSPFWGAVCEALPAHYVPGH